jgi:acyl-CoA thioesterase-1
MRSRLQKGTSAARVVGPAFLFNRPVGPAVLAALAVLALLAACAARPAFATPADAQAASPVVSQSASPPAQDDATYVAAKKEQQAMPQHNSVSDPQGASPSAPAAGPVLVLAFGDSLTAGYGLPPGRSWVDVAAQRFAADGIAVRMVNAGVSGDTTAGGLARLAWVLDGLDRAPDVAVLELGANDMLMGLDPEGVEENLDAMLAVFAERGVRVLLAGMRAMPNLGVEYGAGFDAIYTRLAAKRHVALYPFFLEGVAGIATLNQPDGIHPNAEGARRIAARIHPFLKKLVLEAAAAR